MKYLKYIAIAALASLGLTSCDDFFETDSDSAVTTSDLTEAQVQQLIAGIYSNYSQNNSYRNRYYIIGYNTDIEFNSKTGTPAQLSQYNMTTSNSEVSKADGKDVWGWLSKAVSDAASVIDNVEASGDLSSTSIRHYLGEAYFMRAFATLEMVKIWGDIPVVVSSTETDPYKKDRNEAFELIRSDLKKAAEYLQWSENAPTPQTKTFTRASKQAAFALLARADLMYAGKALRPDVWTVGGGSTCSVQYNIKDAEQRKAIYAEALASCDSVITHDGDSKLDGSFEKVFKDICQDVVSYGKSEWIFAIPFSDGTRGQFLNYTSPKTKDAAGEVLHFSKTNSSNNSTAMVVPTLVYDFDASDARKWVTIAPFKWSADLGSGVSNNAANTMLAFPSYNGTDKILYQEKQSIDKFYLGKFRYEWCDRDVTSGDDGLDIPIIRYADVLLMYAEAAIGSMEGVAPDSANATKAQAAFDKVRTRAGLASIPLTMDNIIKERAFEFCGENIRKYDLERWGLLDSYMEKAADRIKDLNNQTGEFAGVVDDTICFKYNLNDAYLQSGATAKHAYLMDMSTIYGLALGETNYSSYSSADGWVKKNVFESEESGRYLASYKLYTDNEKLHRQHYWPIFQNNVSSSNGTLWNDYGY